jgi:tRNA(fMet)-specific endonuclease VapC
VFAGSYENQTDSLARRFGGFRKREDSVVSLDSSFLIDLLAGEPRAVSRAAELDRTSEPRFVTAPAASEVLVGAYRLGGAYFERTKALVDALPLLAFDRACYHQAGRLGAELLKRGTPLGQGELFVAAISMRYGERLLTNDRAFSRVPGLAVEMY